MSHRSGASAASAAGVTDEIVCCNPPVMRNWEDRRFGWSVRQAGPAGSCVTADVHRSEEDETRHGSSCNRVVGSKGGNGHEALNPHGIMVCTYPVSSRFSLKRVAMWRSRSSKFLRA